MFDASYLEREASRLLRLANSIRAQYAFVGALPAGMAVTYAIMTNRKDLLLPSVMLLVAGVAVGLGLAASRVFQIRLQAHQLLALVHVNEQVLSLKEDISYIRATAPQQSLADVLAEQRQGAAGSGGGQVEITKKLNNIQDMVAQVIRQNYQAQRR